ncbi:MULTISPECIES: hypothetical protein [Pseudomonas]|uniref:hypothetical protein n=1 Tax=Pseudomonas TaxID=286 RepID=UPI001865AE61|nr:hypothetical protein [Pseudomonas lundensis]
MNTCSTIGKTIQLLLEDDFEPEGLTVEQSFRIPKKATQLYYSAGEEISKLSARVRLVRRGTDIRATVTKRSTALFIRAGNDLDSVEDMQSIDTADVSEIQKYLGYLKSKTRG